MGRGRHGVAGAGLICGYGALYRRCHRLRAAAEPEERPPLVVAPDGLRHGRVERRVGSVCGCSSFHRAGRGVGEARADEAWLHDHHAHAEAGDLEAEGVAQGLDGVLRRVVVAAAGEG